jgi:hypothetical protein
VTDINWVLESGEFGWQSEFSILYFSLFGLELSFKISFSLWPIKNKRELKELGVRTHKRFNPGHRELTGVPNKLQGLYFTDTTGQDA